MQGPAPGGRTYAGLGLAEGSLAIWSPCLRTRLFLPSASWAAGTDSRAFLSPSLCPPWQQTCSKQDACLAPGRYLSFHLTALILWVRKIRLSEAAWALQRSNKTGFEARPLLSIGCNAFPRLALPLVSSPQVSETGHWQPPPMPTMCFPGPFHPWQGGGFFEPRARGSQRQQHESLGEILLLGFVQRANMGGVGDSLHAGSLTSPTETLL